MEKQSGMRVAGLVLAAGISKRMGRPKQLLDRDGVTLLDHILGEVMRSELDLVVLVLGHRAQEIRAGLKHDLNDPALRVIENRNYRDGISSSIIAGLSEAEEGYDYCMVILADMPHITAGLINLLLHEYLLSGLDIGAIKTRGRRSLPAIFGRELYSEVYQLSGDTGARGLFLKHADKACLVEPEWDYDDSDIDTPEDYQGFLQSTKLLRF